MKIENTKIYKIPAVKNYKNATVVKNATFSNTKNKLSSFNPDNIGSLYFKGITKEKTPDEIMQSSEILKQEAYNEAKKVEGEFWEVFNLIKDNKSGTEVKNPDSTLYVFESDEFKKKFFEYDSQGNLKRSADYNGSGCLNLSKFNDDGTCDYITFLNGKISGIIKDFKGESRFSDYSGKIEYDFISGSSLYSVSKNPSPTKDGYSIDESYLYSFGKDPVLDEYYSDYQGDYREAGEDSWKTGYKISSDGKFERIYPKKP